LFDLRAKFLQAYRFVSILTAFLLRSNRDAGREVAEPNGALRLVDVLTARATRAERFNFTFPQQIFVGFRQLDHVVSWQNSVEPDDTGSPLARLSANILTVVV
jgi:hypothetical protein